MSKLAIICADGASASFRNRHIRTYMSDVMENILHEHLEKNNGEGVYLKTSKESMLYSPHVAMQAIRGGAFRSKRRKIMWFIDKYNMTGNTLLCVGKSYGGYNMIEVLREFMPVSNYSRVNLFLVDACSIDKIIGQKEFIYPPRVNELWNFHQHNNRYLNGYKMPVVAPWVHQHDLSGVEGLNHWNIVENRFVKRELKQVIEGMINV